MRVFPATRLPFLGDARCGEQLPRLRLDALGDQGQMVDQIGVGAQAEAQQARERQR